MLLQEMTLVANEVAQALNVLRILRDHWEEGLLD